MLSYDNSSYEFSQALVRYVAISVMYWLTLHKILMYYTSQHGYHSSKYTFMFSTIVKTGNQLPSDIAAMSLPALHGF